MNILRKLRNRRHLRPDEFVSVAETLEDGRDLSDSGHAPHLAACAACREALDTLRATLRVFSTGGSTDCDDLAAFGRFLEEDTADADRQASLIDWDDFQASVREQLLARSVRRDTVVRRWTGFAFTPRTAAWTIGALLVLGAAGGLFDFPENRSTPEEVPPESTGAVAEAGDAWFMIEEPDALAVGATAWSHADIFSAVHELDAGEEETLRALLLEAADAAGPEGAPRSNVLSEGSPYVTPYLHQ